MSQNVSAIYGPLKLDEDYNDGNGIQRKEKKRPRKSIRK